MAVALSDMQENYWVQRRSMAACIRHGDHKNRNAALKNNKHYYIDIVVMQPEAH